MRHHCTEGDGIGVAAAGRSDAKARTDKRAKRAADRVRLGASVKGILNARHDAGHAGASARAVARVLGISEVALRGMLQGTKKLGLCDVVNLPPDLALEVLDAARAEVTARRPAARKSLPPAARALNVCAKAGELARVVGEAANDGVIDDSERAAIRAAASALTDETLLVARDLERARTWKLDAST